MVPELTNSSRDHSRLRLSRLCSTSDLYLHTERKEDVRAVVGGRVNMRARTPDEMKSRGIEAAGVQGPHRHDTGRSLKSSFLNPTTDKCLQLRLTHAVLRVWSSTRVFDDSDAHPCAC